MDNTEFLLQEIEGLEKSLKEANDIIESLRKMIHVIEKRDQVEPIDDPTIPDHINKAMKDIYQWMRKESYGSVQTDFTDHWVLKMSVDLENVEPIKIDLSEVLKDD